MHCQNKTKREQEKENTLNRINVTATHLSIICYEIFIVTFDLDPLDDKATQHYLCLEDTPQHHLKQNTILVPFAVRFPKLTAQVIFDQRSLLEEYFSFSLISNFTVTNMSLNSSKHAWVKNPETNYIRLHQKWMHVFRPLLQTEKQTGLTWSHCTCWPFTFWPTLYITIMADWSLKKIIRLLWFWGCTSGGVYVAGIYMHARWEATRVFVVVLVWRLSGTN